LSGEFWKLKWDGSGLSRISVVIPLLYNPNYIHALAWNQIDVSADGHRVVFYRRSCRIFTGISTLALSLRKTRCLGAFHEYLPELKALGLGSLRQSLAWCHRS